MYICMDYILACCLADLLMSGFLNLRPWRCPGA